MAINSIEQWPPLSTGRVALDPATGNTYTYQPNVAGGLVPAVAPPPTDLGDYPGLSTAGVGVDPDGVFWLAHPPSGAPIDLTPLPPPPVNTAPPVLQIVSGNPTPGQTAVCSPGTWVPPQTGGYQRQWYLSGVVIPGQTANTYIIQETDVGGVLTCGIIAIGDGGASAQAMSNSLTIVEPPPADEAQAQPAQQPQAKTKTAPHKHGKTASHAGTVHRRSAGASKR